MMEDSSLKNDGSAAVYGDALIHQPTGLIVDGIEVMDEDGVICSDMVIHFLGNIAQHGGFAFDNMYRVALLLPRAFGPVDDVSEKFSDERDFRLVKNENELGNLIRAWVRPRYVKARTKAQRAQAFERIYSALRRRFTGDERTYRDLMIDIKPPGSGTGGEFDDAADFDMEEYSESAALHGLWELALDKRNQKALMNGRDIITTLAHLVRREAPYFDNDLATSLTGCLWALALQPKPQSRLMTLKMANILFQVIYQQNQLHVASIPKPHLYALGTLRILLEDEENHRFFLGSTSMRGEIDGLKFLAMNMSASQNEEAFTHIMAIILRYVARDDDAMRSFLVEYPEYSGDPAKVVHHFCYLLQDITFNGQTKTKRPRRNSALALMNGKDQGRREVILDVGARLGIAVLLSKLAQHGRTGRKVLLRLEYYAPNHPILSMVRWALHCLSNGTSSYNMDDVAEGSLMGKLTANEGRQTSFLGSTMAGRSRIVDIGAYFDMLESMLTPIFANNSVSVNSVAQVQSSVVGGKPGSTAAQRPVMESGGKTLQNHLEKTSSFVNFTNETNLVERQDLKPRYKLAKAPDLDDEVITRFNQEEWGVTVGRAHEVTIVNAAMSLWGMAKAISELNPDDNPTDEIQQDLEDEAEEEVGKLGISQPRRKKQKETIHTISIRSDEFAKLSLDTNHYTWLSDTFLANLLSLALAARKSEDPKPVVELCAISALNALAHASSPGVRRKLLRLHDEALSGPGKIQRGEDASFLPDPSLVKAERLSEVGRNYSKILSEILVPNNVFELNHPAVNADLGMENAKATLTCVAFGMSALCGSLETCNKLNLCASVAFPYLDVKHILEFCSRDHLDNISGFSSTNDADISEVHITRCLACASIMLHALHPAFDDVEYGKEVRRFPQWTPETCKMLLDAIQGERSRLPPTGSNLTYLALSVWSLANERPLQMIMLEQGYIPTLLTRVEKTVDLLEVYHLASKNIARNATDIGKLEKHTRSTLKITQTENVSEHVAQERMRILNNAREHLFSLSALLTAIWNLVANRELFKATGESKDVVMALAINIDDESQDRILLKKSRKELFQTILRILRVTSIGQKHASLSYLYKTYQSLMDEITRTAVCILWALAALRISDRTLCKKETVQAILDLVYNSNIASENRRLVAQMLLYMDRLPPKSETSTTIRRTMERRVSPTYLCEIVLHLLGSEDERLRSCGAEMLGRIRSTRVGQALIRNNGGIELLLELTVVGTNDIVVSNSLKGLRHVSLDFVSQESLCKKGLYHLLYLAWTSTNIDHKRMLAQILKQLSENPKNTTAIYVAELRARHILGYRGIKDPNEAQVKQFKEEVREMDDKQRRNKYVGSSSGDHGRKGGSMPFKGKNGDIKNDFMDWLEGLRVEQATKDAVLSYQKTSATKIPKVNIRKRRSSEDGAESVLTGNKVQEVDDPLLYEDIDEKNAPKVEEEPKRMVRTLSSFLRECRGDDNAEHHHHSDSKAGGTKKTRRPDLEIVVPCITGKNATPAGMPMTMQPTRPEGSSPTGRVSPRLEKLSPSSPRFKQAKSPVESPLWELRGQINYPGKEKDEKRVSIAKLDSPRKPTKTKTGQGMLQERPVMHSRFSPLSEEEHQHGNKGFVRNMCQPVRSLWAPDSLYTNVGKERWSPGVKEITLKSPRQIDEEDAFIKFGPEGVAQLRAKEEAAEDDDVENDNELLEDGESEKKLESGEVDSVIGGFRKSRRVNQVNVKMDSSRPYSQFVFNRGGDPYSNLRSWESIKNSCSYDSDTSLSSDECDSEDEEEEYEVDDDELDEEEEEEKDVKEDQNDDEEKGQNGIHQEQEDEVNNDAHGENPQNPQGDEIHEERPIARDGEQTEIISAISIATDKKSEKTRSAKKKNHEEERRKPRKSLTKAEKKAREKMRKQEKAEKLVRKKRRDLRRKQLMEYKRRIQNMSTPKRVTLSKFHHVEGARIYEDIPRYRLPNGEEIYLYLAGGPLFGTDTLEDVDPPPLCPCQTTELQFPNEGLPEIPKLESSSDQIVGGLIPLPIPFPSPPTPETFSLQQYGGRQPGSQVSWGPGGHVQDEPLPMKTAYRDEVMDNSDDVPADETPWSLDKSVFAARGKAHDSFYNEKIVRDAAFEKEWQLCEQKRTFRKLSERYDSAALSELRTIMRDNYDIVCNMFRYYSSLDQDQGVFTLGMQEFTDFCTQSGIRENEHESLIQEGHCNTIFIQVSRNPIEDRTTQQEMFEEDCGVLTLKKGNNLMRFGFLEALIRVAEAKYVHSKQVGDIGQAAKRLFKLLREVQVIQTVHSLYDDFRKHFLYCESVDNRLREHLQFLKDLFLRFAGRSNGSKRAGGLKGKRLTYEEWNSLLVSVGMYNPLFTVRDSNLIFRGSSLDVSDEIAHWRQIVALSFPDFLEAICRTANAMVIPTKNQLEEVGADDIVEYYSIMEATGLWLVLAESNSTETEGPPLHERLRALFKLLQHIEERKAKQALEEKLWKKDPKAMLEQAEQDKLLLRQQEDGNSLKFQKRTTIKGVDAKITRPLNQAQRQAAEEQRILEEEENQPVSSLQKAIAAVEAGVPMERFEAHVAATLHDVWREQRPKRSDGTYEPRIKTIKGVQYDIANLSFADLPGYFQMENLLAAFDACEAIRKAFEENEKEGLPIVRFYVHVESEGFLEEASAHQHEHWLKRNSRKPWLEDCQKVSWAELKEEDKRKNRDIVNTAVKVWIAHQRQ